MNTQADQINSQHIIERSRLLQKVRIFLNSKNYIEIDAPHVNLFPAIDTFIDPISTKEGLFLHTSPEFSLKKTLSKFHHNIYFLGHVYRKEEVGSLHKEEFTMIEWYKIKTTEEEFLQEVCALLNLFLSTTTYSLSTYQEVYNTFVDENSMKSLPETQLWSSLEKRHYLFATQVEPNLGKKQIDVITDFPKEDAALAQTALVNGIEVAKRYEFFYNGIEIGNAFFELTDSEEQKRRFNEINKGRSRLGKEHLKIDPEFIQSIEQIPPNTYGIAVGFDRLFMIHQNLSDINTVTH